MVEMTFRIRWPDGQEENIYSPSPIVRDFFREGDRFLLTEFIARSRGALSLASEQVPREFGFVCERTTEQLARLEQTAARFSGDREAAVLVISLDPAPRPAQTPVRNVREAPTL